MRKLNSQVKTWERIVLVALKYTLPPLLVLTAQTLITHVYPDVEQCISTIVIPWV